MYGLLSDTAPLSSGKWEPDELERVVTMLVREFPGKTRAELEHAVEFCKGAVRRRQGCEALEQFAAALLRSVDLHLEKQRRGRPAGRADG